MAVIWSPGAAEALGANAKKNAAKLSISAANKCVSFFIMNSLLMFIVIFGSGFVNENISGFE